MKVIYIILGFICVALGIIGIPTPVLPTTPFLLAAMFFFGKGSDRIQRWFVSTSLYHKYLKEFDENRAMTLKQKITILLVSTPFTVFAIFFLPNIWGKLCLVLVIIVQYWYFFFKIKTIQP